MGKTALSYMFQSDGTLLQKNYSMVSVLVPLTIIHTHICICVCVYIHIHEKGNNNNDDDVYRLYYDFPKTAHHVSQF